MLLFKDVSFGFGDHRILDAISFECHSGLVCGIVGRSGVGKTTILNLAAGWYRNVSGTVLIDGRAPGEAAREQKVGYVFQSPSLIPWATVMQNVALPLQLHPSRNGSRVDWTHVRHTLERTHIAHAADKYPHELSGGMQTRVGIARALVYRPSVLLLDEPFNGLDDMLKEQFIYPELQDLLAAEQKATVLVTHNLNEALLLCDRVYVLRAESGREPSRLVHREDVPFPRPRTPVLYENTEFMTARRRIREHLS